MPRTPKPFLFAKRLEPQVSAKSRLTNELINPSNYEKMRPERGVVMPRNFRGRTAQSAAKEIDTALKIAQDLERGTEVAKVWTDVARKQEKLEKALINLRKAVLSGEITKEKGFSLYQTGLNKLATMRKSYGLQHAADVALEQSAYDKLTAGLQTKLVASNYTSPFELGAAQTLALNPASSTAKVRR